mmetsp:Transcript_39401/g.47799  ORF Transcript_39401/g.47799 Transcript_39401/m.47799 type:complete len:383 (-) Transcript_39401:799-1947(-)
MADPKDEESMLERAEKLINQSRALSERVAKELQKTKRSNELLSTEVTTLKQEIESLERLFEQEDVPLEATESLLKAKHILSGGGPGADLCRILPPPKNPAAIHLLLGKSVNLITPYKEDCLKLKADYYTFRDKHTMIFVCFTGLLLLSFKWVDLRDPSVAYSFAPFIKVLVQVFLCWMMYFYTAMALRESVLKMNGSKIPDWWIYHHYLSIVVVMIMITLPVDSPAVDQWIAWYVSWAFMQGMIMFLQNRYQRRRMYTRIAMGKSSNMDVVGGDASGINGQLLLLYPLLFALQAFQGFIGVISMKATYQAVLSPEGWLDMEKHESDLRGSRGIFACGFFFFFLALGNFHATFATIIGKRKYRKMQMENSMKRSNSFHNGKAS